ncbi:MAG: hypothetical protein HQL96_14730 [Magnetococcales bacterium]|nr:hypothetical protein [Magnetococcales bacterium]
MNRLPWRMAGWLVLFLAWPADGQAVRQKAYRQPAYISNAYLSDRIAQKGESVQPLSVVKALQANINGVLGYFVLDVVLTVDGQHRLKVDILDDAGRAKAALQFPPVQVQKKDELPMYTAAGAISGEMEPGLWFFKVYDQVNKEDWKVVGIFGFMVMDPKKE